MTPKSRQWENKDLMKFSVALVFICLMKQIISVDSVGVDPHIELSAVVLCYI